MSDGWDIVAEYADTVAFMVETENDLKRQIATLCNEITAARLERDRYLHTIEQLQRRVWALAIMLRPDGAREAVAGDIGWPSEHPSGDD